MISAVVGRPFHAFADVLADAAGVCFDPKRKLVAKSRSIYQDAHMVYPICRNIDAASALGIRQAADESAAGVVRAHLLEGQVWSIQIRRGMATEQTRHVSVAAAFLPVRRWF